MTTTQDARRCRARTEDGDRCSRPADGDDFCYQHGPEDATARTVTADGGETGVELTADGRDGNGSTDPSDTAGSGGDIAGVMDVRALVEDVTGDVVGAPLDRIIEVGRRDDGDGWLVVVEAVERRAVPDTEDLLGRYEIQLDGSGTVEGYRRGDRYRRGADLDDG